jgi:hypothetical protein
MEKKPKKLRPPPNGSRCDSYFASEAPNGPHLHRCPNAATVSRPGFPAENWLCAKCDAEYEKRKAHP